MKLDSSALHSLLRLAVRLSVSIYSAMDDDGNPQSSLSLPAHRVPQSTRSKDSNLSVDEMKSGRGHVSTTPPAKKGTMLQPSPENPSQRGSAPSPTAESAHAKSLLLSTSPPVGPVSVEDASTLRGGIVGGVNYRAVVHSLVSPGNMTSSRH